MAAVAGNGMIASDDQFLRSPASPRSDDSKSGFQRDVRELVDLLSKLNPSAKEFFPSSYSPDRQFQLNNLSFTDPLGTINGAQTDSSNDGSSSNRRKKNSYNPGRKRLNGRALRAHREDSVRRTVYVSDISQNVTEEQLAALFTNCGQVVDCRVCGDPHSILRFAFIEFSDERNVLTEGARAALNLGGAILGYYPVRVLPSKTAILPVNPTFLPRSEDEREMCTRTVYCTNIDKEVSQTDVKVFFESICGQVSRLRLLGDNVHSTRIAFVEFVTADSAIMALSYSGMILGTLPIRVSPSKTPVRPRVPRAMLH